MQEQPGRIVRWGRSLWQRVRRVWRSCVQWFGRWLWSPFVRGIRAVRRWLQRACWRLSECWLVSSVVTFLKALLLLALWLGVAFAVFHIFSCLIQIPGTDKSLALLATLVTALVGFGVQQWKSLTEEERDRRQRRQKAIEEIEGLGSLLRSDPSMGARRYVELKARGGREWKSGQVQYTLQELWNTTAPVELRRTVELLSCLEEDERFFKVAESIGARDSVYALLWARENLDDDWRQKAFAGIQQFGRRSEYRQHIPGEVLLDAEQSSWRAILRPWPHVSPWRGFPPSADPELAKGLRFLRLESSPFGSGEAETDTLLLTCRVAPPWLGDLRGPRPALLVGAPGSGKTATALLLAYDDLRERETFPVYRPITSGALRLSEVARVLAQTLLCYLATTPADFLKREVAGRGAIAHLLIRYAPPNLALCFHQAGLPFTGERKLLQEIDGLTQCCSFRKPLTDNGLLALLGEARPRGFRYTTFLLDVQTEIDEGEDTSSDRYLQSLLDLSDRLARVAVFVKAFLPGTFQQALRRARLPEPVSLEWSDDDLSMLLEDRLKQFGDETLAAWCDPREGDLSPDSRLLNAAQGTPGSLMRKGNELLRRIGQTQRLLTARDLDEVLGPAPAQPDEAEP